VPLVHLPPVTPPGGQAQQDGAPGVAAEDGHRLGGQAARDLQPVMGDRDQGGQTK